MPERPEIARSDMERRSYKREILIVAVVAAALILGGAAYTLIKGPTTHQTDFKGPIEVHGVGPATMPVPPAPARRPSGGAPP